VRPNIHAVRVAGFQQSGVARDAFRRGLGAAAHVVKGGIHSNLLHERNGGALGIVGRVESEQAGNLERQVNVRGVVLALEGGCARSVLGAREGALEFGFNACDRRPVGKIAVERGRCGCGKALPGSRAGVLALDDDGASEDEAKDYSRCSNGGEGLHGDTSCWCCCCWWCLEPSVQYNEDVSNGLALGSKKLQVWEKEALEPRSSRTALRVRVWLSFPWIDMGLSELHSCMGNR